MGFANGFNGILMYVFGELPGIIEQTNVVSCILSIELSDITPSGHRHHERQGREHGEVHWTQSEGLNVMTARARGMDARSKDDHLPVQRDVS